MAEPGAIKLKTAITFFAGAGGACAGLEQAGFEVTWANEYYGPIADIWQLNHPAATLDRRDILELPIEDIPDADLHWYSPPCQLYSKANRNRTGGTDREDVSIAQKLGAIIMAKLPEAIVIENVPGYARSHSFEYLLIILSHCGYNVSWSVLNAADYGTPQNRKRLILVARLSGAAALPHPTHGDESRFICEVGFQSSKTQGVATLNELRDNLSLSSLLPYIGWHEAISDLFPSMQPTKVSQPQQTQLERRGLADCSEPLLLQLTGYYKQHGPTILFSHEPIWTITAHMAHDGKVGKSGFSSFRSPATVLADVQALRVDRLCLARFQGFSDSYRWGPIESVNCRGIGNAVPPPLSKAIGLSLK
jgi:DNA (cytosine-5)-methyltransferase 1